MANARGEALDKTHLSVYKYANRRHIMHRDYLAHMARWSHVVHVLRRRALYKTAQLLDVGCGVDAPLALTLFSNFFSRTTGSYTGVDFNELDPEWATEKIREKHHLTFHGDYDFALRGPPKRAQYDVVTSFEVLEHVEPAQSLAILQGIRQALTPTGLALVSTPVYDQHVGAADNHVNEMSRDALQLLLEVAGLKVERSFGTFASQRDYKADELDRWGLERAWPILREYWSPEYLAILFAPLWPERARNVVWHLRRGNRMLKLDEKYRARLRSAEHSSSSAWPSFIDGLLT